MWRLMACLVGLLAWSAARAGDLTIGISQFPSNLHPNIESMAAKSYVLGLTQRPFTAYDDKWELVCMLCTELPTFENGKAVRETTPDGRSGVALTFTIHPDATWADGTPVTPYCGADQGYKITPKQLEAAITPKTVGVIFNSPSNPCGVAYRPDEIEAFAQVLARHPQVTVISDEIYEKLIYPEIDPALKARSFGAFPELAERTVTINGMSKAYAMTGWRVGYICAPGDNGRFAKELIKLQGQIESFDQYVVLLRNTVTQMVYKHAISTVVPSRPVSMPHHAPGSDAEG